MKTYRSITWLFMFIIVPSFLWGQQVQERQLGDTTYYKTLIPEAKQGLLRNMSMIANMQFAYRTEFYNGEYTQSRFRNEQFRLEFRGQVTDKVYFRFRDRYTRAQTSESLDNLSRSVDLAFIRVGLSDKWSLSAGKMCADWGAFEFDYNPIDIYEYSDIIEFADNFLTGVGLSWTATDNHQFTFQVLDSRTKTFNELYGAQPDFEESKAPLALVFNWRGNLFDGKVKTIWSYAAHREAHNIPEDKPAAMHYVALGTEVTLGKLVVAYDFKLSDEDLDRTTIVSSTVPDNLYPFAVQDVSYVGHWVHIHYRVNQKVNLSFQGFLDIANWNQEGIENKPADAHIRDAWGFIPTFEYYPWEDVNLRFFVNYVARIYQYSDFAIDQLGAEDFDTGRFNVGFVTPLGIF